VRCGRPPRCDCERLRSRPAAAKLAKPYAPERRGPDGHALRSVGDHGELQEHLLNDEGEAEGRHRQVETTQAQARKPRQVTNETREHRRRRGFYNLVEAGEIEFTRNPRTGHRQFCLVELDRIKAKLATRPRRGRPRVQFPD